MFNIFPRKILAPEVTARRRAGVDGVQQVQLLDDARRVRSYALRTAAAKQSSSQMPVPKVFTSTMTGSFSPDGIRQRDLTAVGKMGGDHVFGNVPRHVCAAAIHLGGILAAERTAAVAGIAAVGVHDDLAARQAGVALRAAHNKAAAGDVVLVFSSSSSAGMTFSMTSRRMSSCSCSWVMSGCAGWK